VAAVLALSSAPCEAAAEGHRVLFVAASTTPFSERVRAEIEAQGFELEAASAVAEDRTSAVAAARVVEGPARRVELWIADAETGHLVLRAVVVPSPDDDDAIQTVRASEQFRAFFQRLHVSAPRSPAISSTPPAPEAASQRARRPTIAEDPSPPSLEPPPTPRRRFVIGAALAVPFQSGGPGLDLEVRGRWMATRGLGVGAFVTVPLAGSTVTASEGSAAISAPLFGADLALAVDFASRLRLSTSAGLALAWVRTRGVASAPYKGQSSDVAAALVLLGGGIAPRLTDRMHLCIDGRVGFSVPRVDIAFADRPVATWGRPLGLLSAGVSVDL
jgi:hypothetical protein